MPADDEVPVRVHTKNGQTYDVIVDAVGKHSFLRSRGSLVPGGRHVASWQKTGNVVLNV